MERLLKAAPRLGCQIVQQRRGLLVLGDGSTSPSTGRHDIL
jgi:hypothetical protein